MYGLVYSGFPRPGEFQYVKGQRKNGRSKRLQQTQPILDVIRDVYEHSTRTEKK